MISDYAIILISAILSFIPLLVIKQYSRTGEKNLSLICIAVIADIFLISTYIVLCRRFSASKIFAIVKILSIVLFTIIAVLLLGETISKKFILGIIFGIIALVLLTKG